MKNEPSELVRVVTRCALLCLDSRALDLLTLSVSWPFSDSHFRSRAVRDEDARENERAGERLKNDRPSGQRALGAASSGYSPKVTYQEPDTYREYVQDDDDDNGGGINAELH